MSIKYATGITIAKTTTVRAIAIASGYEKSEVATATYTIVTVPTH
jgi:NADPH-dependent curcumin reductase CurA